MQNILEQEPKKKMTTYTIMDFAEFESLLKDPNHRNISDSSYITYKRNLDLLFTEMGDLSLDDEVGYNFAADQNKSIQEKCYFIAKRIFDSQEENGDKQDPAYCGPGTGTGNYLAMWSNSTKRARIAALLVGIDPSGKEEDLESETHKIVVGGVARTTKQDFHYYKTMKLQMLDTAWESKYFHNSANDVPVSARTGSSYINNVKFKYPEKAILIQKLRKVCEDTQKNYKKKVSEMNVKESANWVDFKHLEKRAAAVRKKYNDIKPEYDCDDINFPDWSMPVLTSLTDAIVATVYTRFPPRRLDWSKLEFFVDPTDYLGLSQELKDKTVAFYNNTIIFGKKAGKSHQQDDYVITKKEIGSVLLKLLRTQEKLVRCYYGKALVLHPEGVYMMRTIPLKRGGRMTENSLGKRITRIFTFKNKTKKANLGLKVKKKKANCEEFGKKEILESDSGISRIRKCSAGMLRKIYISEKFTGDRILKSKIAHAMNHSVRIQQAIYNKKGLEMTSNDIIQFEVNQHHLDSFL